jgi:hypothetical protein
MLPLLVAVGRKIDPGAARRGIGWLCATLCGSAAPFGHRDVVEGWAGPGQAPGGGSGCLSQVLVCTLRRWWYNPLAEGGGGS